MPTKAEKAAVKEGGKKGQDLQGMNAMGGVKFFAVVVETAGGDWKLMDMILDGMNKKVDEAAEERKGGASDIGKCLMFADDAALLMLCHVPESLKDDINQKDWFDAINKPVDGKPEEITPYEGEGKGFIIKCTVPKDEEKQKFPLKLREEASNASFEFLVEKGLVRPEESDDDENYAENAGIEW